MTDTRDIAVLYAIAVRAKETGTSFVIPAETAISMLTHIGVLRDNLEAERQRAAEINRQYHRVVSERDDAVDELEELRNEISHLKGDQVPVFQQYFYDAWHDCDKGEYECSDSESRRVLFTAPQKPVVLSAPIIAIATEFAEELDSVAHHEFNDDSAPYSAKLAAAIEATGGKVADGYIFCHPDGKLFWSIVSESCANGKGVVPYYLTAPQKPVVHPDTKRMDWLCAHCVEVRDPQMYGSHAMFHAQQDSEEWDLPHHTTLREQVDAAIEAAGGIVKDGE